MKDDFKKSEKDNREKKAKDFGAKLEKLMKEKHISQNMLARKIPINRSNINKYLKGESTPRIDTFLVICEILQVEPNYFFETKFCDYQVDNSKSEERKLIESLFYLFNCGVLENAKNINNYDTRYVIDLYGYDTIIKICEECETYAKSDLVEDFQISNKIVEKFEGQLREEREYKSRPLDPNEPPF